MRPLWAADEPWLERFVLMVAYSPAHALPEGAREMAHVRRWLDGWSALERGVCWEEHGEVIGAAWARRVEPVLACSPAGERLREVVLAVDPARRGEGIGGKLVEALIAQAREAGESGLCLSVSEQNTDAVGLYERFGFAAIGRTPSGLLSMALYFDDC